VWRVLASLLGAAVVLAAGVAAAAGTPPVHLEVEHCESLDEASIRRIFSADLGAPAAEVGPEVTEVAVSCEGDKVVVRVKDPLSRKTVKRSFDPKSFGNQGQSRLIAIAGSELVLARWAELTENPTPTVPAEGEPANAATLETARSVVKARSAVRQRAETEGASTGGVRLDNPYLAKKPAARSEPPEADGNLDAGALDRGPNVPTETEKHPAFQRVMAVISLRSFANGAGTLYGGGARVGQDRYGVVSWTADALIENGRLSSRNVTSATVGGSLAFYLHSGPATLRLGAGLRGGMLGLANGAAIAPWGWPMAVTSMTVRGGPLVFEVGGEGGFVDLLLQRSQPVHGFWGSGQLGFGLVL
jgi:hypothetical protein